MKRIVILLFILFLGIQAYAGNPWHQVMTSNGNSLVYTDTNSWTAIPWPSSGWTNIFGSLVTTNLGVNVQSGSNVSFRVVGNTVYIDTSNATSTASSVGWVVINTNFDTSVTNCTFPLPSALGMTNFVVNKSSVSNLLYIVNGVVTNPIAGSCTINCNSYLVTSTNWVQIW